MTLAHALQLDKLDPRMPRILKAYPQKSYRFTDNFIQMALPASG
ncbi:MAG: hypothetical protein ACPGN3_17235 [Opitutales bacterium]